MKYVFACVLIPEKVGGYSVTFPDIGGATQGDSLYEALEMAEELANAEVEAALEEGEELPVPTPIEEVEVPAGAILTLIRVDTDAYRKGLSAS